MMKEKKVSVRELCDCIGMKYEVLGPVDRYVSRPSQIDEANEESVSFCSKKAVDALQIIRNSKAGVIICSNELAFAEEDYQDRTLIVVSNPRRAFIRVMREHFEEKVAFGIHPTAVIDEEAEIHPNVYVGPNSHIGKCKIGENTIIYGNIYVYSNVRIGRNVIIHAGTVIGADGQGYERNDRGELEKFPQIGGVVVEDDVEIGSNVSIMKGTFGNTTIGQGTKIGHLSSVGHNVIIGKHCLIITKSMIGGSCRIGDHSQVSLGACIRDGIDVGKKSIVGMGSVVTKNIDDSCVAIGVPARVVKRLDNPRDAEGK